MDLKTKIFLSILGLVILMVGGCGTRNWDEFSYYDPNWTPEGLIYARKVVGHYVEDWQGLYLGGLKKYKDSETTTYVTLDTSGNNEQTLAYPYYPYYSPGGTYVCYVDSTSTFYIIRRSDNQGVYSFQPTTTAIAELDWGPDEDKLVYRPTGSESLFVIGVDGNNKVEISGVDAAQPTWRFSSRIAFLNTVGEHYYLAFTTSDGSSIETTSLPNEVVGSYPQYYSDGQSIFSKGNEKFNKITIVSSDVYSYDNNLPAGKTHVDPKLSPNDQKVIGGFSQESGIWLVGTDGIGANQIK